MYSRWFEIATECLLYIVLVLSLVIKWLLQNSSCDGRNSSTSNTTCCTDCLGMSPQEYNLLYAIYAWTYVTHCVVLSDIELVAIVEGLIMSK